MYRVFFNADFLHHIVYYYSRYLLNFRFMTFKKYVFFIQGKNKKLTVLN